MEQQLNLYFEGFHHCLWLHLTALSIQVTECRLCGGFQDKLEGLSESEIGDQFFARCDLSWRLVVGRLSRVQ